MSEDREPKRSRGRARGFAIALVVLASVALVAFWPRGGSEFEFRVEGLPDGFRMVGGDRVSAGLDPFAGLFPAEPAQPRGPTIAGSELCRALFGAPTGASDVVPIAVFSDHRCPNCRILEPQIEALAEDDGAVALTYHQWPIFGPPSELSARAALAAGEQGAYAQFHQRMLQSAFVATPEYLELVAEELGLDGARLLRDAEDPSVEAQMTASRTLANQFGMRGTPATIVGATMIEGAVDRGVLRDLIARERADGAWRAC